MTYDLKPPIHDPHLEVSVVDLNNRLTVWRSHQYDPEQVGMPALGVNLQPDWAINTAAGAANSKTRIADAMGVHLS